MTGKPASFSRRMAAATKGSIRNRLVSFKEPTSSVIVPSRSRKTAGRNGDCSSTLHLDRGQPWPCRGLHHVGRDCGHAPVIGRTAAEKTWAAVWLLLNDAAPRRDGSSSLPIGWTKHGDDGQADSRGYVHRARIVADEEMTLREQRGQIGDCRFPCEINGRPAHLGRDGRRDARLRRSSKENDVGIRLRLQPVCHLGKPRRRPALRRSILCAGPDSNSQRALTHAGFAKKLVGTPALLF